MKTALCTGIALLILISGLAAADRAVSLPPAPYLLATAPSFDLTISQFREKYNAAHPTLPIAEYRAISGTRPGENLTRAASKINDNLYSSTALEHGSGKIRSLQVTWLPVPGDGAKPARETALAYMAALLETFAPMLTAEQAQQRIATLLARGKGQRYYSQTEGALRYVVADNGDKGITFALEPIKLALGPE
ncbi:DUF1454 family protein [Pantoea sp. 1.19]|uniref:DUF1454 family protein n=1 Tax=Pantoea sp. 1.19 TaxID=1925589 RepID=UPI0009488A44|nr:DUF1454 family protein [Pantoea sp. 1.19]